MVYASPDWCKRSFVTLGPFGGLFFGDDMTFLEAVNRILRITTVMQWDDDDITSFSQNQHAGSVALCRQAIQHVINELVSDRFLWPERVSTVITAEDGTRKYDLADDFVRFLDKNNWFQELEGGLGSDATGQFLSEYPGGETQLKKEVPAYTSQTGTPQWYYFIEDRKIGIYPIPDSEKDDKLYRYMYEKDVMPENESDSLPFDQEMKAYAFTDMAARVFTFLFVPQPLADLENDLIYKRAKSALMSLGRKAPPNGTYGFRYG